VGRWSGTTEGQPGKGTVEREYTRVLGSRFVQVKNRSTYPAQEKNPKGEVHEDGRSLLACIDVDTDYAVLPCGPFLRRALKTVKSLHDADAGESHAVQHVDKLCLRQSTGDSTRPEIDIASHRL
jgi:hypothetical protein